MLDVRRLQIFAVVAEHGSITAAAKALFMRYSAVSQQVALLERQLGLDLLVRGPRGVELTAAGLVLVERSGALLGGVGDVEREMRDLAGRNTSVRLATFPTAGADLIPKVLSDYQKRFPAIRVELRSAHAGDMVTFLREGSVHLGLVWDYDFAPRTFAADIERIGLFADPLCVLVPSDHPLAGEAEVTLADLAGETWVVRAHRPPYSEAFALMCRLAGFEPDVGFVTEDYQSARGLVAAGIGLSAAPRLSLVGRRPGVVAMPLAGFTPHRRIAALWLRDADHPDAARRMLEMLREGMAGGSPQPSCAGSPESRP